MDSRVATVLTATTFLLDERRSEPIDQLAFTSVSGRNAKRHAVVLSKQDSQLVVVVSVVVQHLDLELLTQLSHQTQQVWCCGDKVDCVLLDESVEYIHSCLREKLIKRSV
jgi:hypothetical protein